MESYNPRRQGEQSKDLWSPIERQPDFKYEILKSPADRAEYIRLTDELIARLIKDQTEVTIFLDKSARPVAWLVKELWPILAPVDSETGEQFKLPEIKFLNIDREQWGAVLGRSEDGAVNVDRLPTERLNELKAVFAPVASVSKPSDVSLMTNKNVMVIDEVRQSGDTLHMAKKILDKAFPDAGSVEGAYWMQAPSEYDPKSGGRLGGKVPIWYSDREVTGRLVGDRDTNKSMRSSSSRQRVGRYWLSARFREPDVRGRMLKQEVKQLAQDLVEHRIIYMPSLLWSEETHETIAQRIERINGITPEEFAHLRRTSNTTQDLIDHYQEAILFRF